MTYEAQYCNENARTELKYIKQYNDNLGNEECYYNDMLRELAEFLEHPNFMGLNDEDEKNEEEKKDKELIFALNKGYKRTLCKLSERLDHFECETIYNYLIDLLDNAHNSVDFTNKDYIKSLEKIQIIIGNIAPNLIIG